MSLSNYIANLLNIKDQNIVFTSKIVKIEIKNTNFNKINATLSYKPTLCTKCGNSDKNLIIKYGFKNTCVSLPSCSNLPIRLNLKKQRFLSKKRQKTLFC